MKPKFKEAVGLSGFVFKGGSMGQGTTIPHHYNIDLVFYSKECRVKISETIKAKERGQGERKWQVRNINMPKFSLSPLLGLKDALDELYRTTLTKIERYLCQELHPHYKLDDIRGVALKFQYLLSPQFKKKEQFFQFLQMIQPPLERLRYN